MQSRKSESDYRIVRSDKIEIGDDMNDLASSHASVISAIELGPTVERTTDTKKAGKDGDQHRTLNIGMVGNGEVGKTSLIKKFMYNEHIDGHSNLATIGIDYFVLHVQINEELYKITIWDTAGQERHRSLTKNYYNTLDAVILVFSMTDEKSFEAALRWLKEI